MALPRGTQVEVEFRKWPDRPHWRYPMVVLGDDEHGRWLFAPAGTPTRRGDEPVRYASHAFLSLVEEGAWRVPIFNAGGPICVYVDLATPPVWEGTTVRMIDLDLDVVRRTDGTVAVVDEDEFADHRLRYDYPDGLVDAVEAEAARTRHALACGLPPFHGVADEWMEVGRDLIP